MSLATVLSRALDGIHAPLVSVEVHLANGLPGCTLVGLPDTEVKEARDRVRAALLNSGFLWPQKRITVNLAPADLPKESGRFDLPIALGILLASGQLPNESIRNYEFAGELSLSGALRPVRGALAMVLASQDSARQFILPLGCAAEAALAQDAQVFGAESLFAVCAHLRGEDSLSLVRPPSLTASRAYPDLAEVRGQAQAKRVLEIAAAGGHSLLMYGPPGSGKSMLAARLPGLLPPLGQEAARASAAVLSLSGRFQADEFGQRPFRTPHHTASAVALVGGGNPPRPGEISLAHHGLLFLDELPEFNRKVLETLREPLESGVIHISRAGRSAEFPANFQFIAAMNPCPCGWLGHSNNKCRCNKNDIVRYRGRLSGPLLDRIDLQIEVPALPAEDLQAAAHERGQVESSAKVQQRVIAAHARQVARCQKSNAKLSSAEIEAHCQPDAQGNKLLKQAMVQLDLSARAYHRILKVSRTIADLAGDTEISALHIAEAIQYRRFAAT